MIFQNNKNKKLLITLLALVFLQSTQSFSHMGLFNSCRHIKVCKEMANRSWLFYAPKLSPGLRYEFAIYISKWLRIRFEDSFDNKIVSNEILPLTVFSVVKPSPDYKHRVLEGSSSENEFKHLSDKELLNLVTEDDKHNHTQRISETTSMNSAVQIACEGFKIDREFFKGGEHIISIFYKMHLKRVYYLETDENRPMEFFNLDCLKCNTEKKKDDEDEFTPSEKLALDSQQSQNLALLFETFNISNIEFPEEITIKNEMKDDGSVFDVNNFVSKPKTNSFDDFATFTPSSGNVMNNVESVSDLDQYGDDFATFTPPSGNEEPVNDSNQYEDNFETLNDDFATFTPPSENNMNNNASNNDSSQNVSIDDNYLSDDFATFTPPSGNEGSFSDSSQEGNNVENDSYDDFATFTPPSGNEGSISDLNQYEDNSNNNLNDDFATFTPPSGNEMNNVESVSDLGQYGDDFATFTPPSGNEGSVSDLNQYEDNFETLNDGFATFTPPSGNEEPVSDSSQYGDNFETSNDDFATFTPPSENEGPVSESGQYEDNSNNDLNDDFATFTPPSESPSPSPESSSSAEDDGEVKDEDLKSIIESVF